MTTDTHTTPDYDAPQPTQIAGYEKPHEWLGKKGESHYIPSWYHKHANIDLEVKCAGQPQGFKIRNVMPYRRWAIDGNGNVLPQYEFEPLYLRYLADWTVPETSVLQSEYIPNVLTFVRAKPDLVQGVTVDIAYHDDGRVVKEEKYTQDGDIAPEFLMRHEEQAKESGAMRMLAKLAAEGKLSTADFAAKAAELLGETPKPTPARVERGEETDAEMVAAPPIAKTRKPRKQMTPEAKAAAVERLRLAREAKARKSQTELVVSAPIGS